MTFRFQTAFRLQAVCVNHSNGLVTRSLETARSSGFLTRYTVRNISPFERLSYAFVRNIKPFKRLGHPFVEDIRPLERLGHLYSGIPLNFLSNDMHGRRVTLFIKKIHLLERSFNSMFSRFV